MKVLMIGATGRFAGLVVPELKKKGVVVRALVQDANKAAIAKTKGADETVLGNLEDEESLLKASKGMDGVFHIIPAFQRLSHIAFPGQSCGQAARMNEATHLLSHLTISETGYKLGFINLSHFGRVFEKHFQMKPKRYKDSLN